MTTCITNVSATVKSKLTKVGGPRHACGGTLRPAMGKKSGKPSPTPLGLDIARLRKERGWSQMDLVQRSGQTSVGMIESGQRVNPQFGTVKAIADALGVDPLMLGKKPGAEPLPEALAEFMGTSTGQTVTPEELEWLRGLRARGKRPTLKTYFEALATLRSMEDEP